MTSVRSGLLILLLATAALLLAGCGGSSSSGSVSVQVEDSGTPNPPEIEPPSTTTRFRLEVLDPDGSERVAPARDQEYSGSGGATVELPDVPQGNWVVRLSAFDAAGQVVAHYQEQAQVGSGSKVALRAWLHPGPAPEGLLFVANSRGASLSIVRLTDGRVEDLPLPSNPEFLYSARGKIYATTGGSQIMAVEGVQRNVLVLPAPNGGLFVGGADEGVVSYPLEGGIRFLDPVNDTFSDLYRTGATASGISRQVGSTAWVANAGDSTLTAVDVPARALGTTLQVGGPGLQVDQNDAGTRIYVVGGGRTTGAAPFLRVLEPSGNLVWHHANQLEAPISVHLEGDRAYVTDALRGELVVIQDGETPSERERFRIGEGYPTQMLSDGTRLFVTMEASSEVAVVDMATLSLVTRYRVGQFPRGMALLR